MTWSILVEDIPVEGLDLKKEEMAAYFGLENNEFVFFTDPVSVSLRIEKEGPRVRLNGEFSLRAGHICTRCLDKFSREVRSSIDTVYEPEPAKITGGETYASEEELKPAYYGKEKTIDLGEEIRQEVILSLAVKPLCREDCRGLCPSCGQNLNRGGCSCSKEKTDPRFAKLKFFKAQKHSENERKK